MDNCCYNRPYDDQTQLRISLESQAKMYVQNMIGNDKLELVTSFMLTYENSKNRSEEKRNAIAELMMNENITTAEIVERGYRCLFKNLGTIETERFIAYILSERFDYTKWRREYFRNATVEELVSSAVDYEKAHPFVSKKTQIPIE